MEWCKLYATFATDPKVRGLSDRAFRTYIEALCYSSLHETDGLYDFVRATTRQTPRKSDAKVERELRNAGLLDADGHIHNWSRFNPTKAALEEKRTAWRDRQRAHRAAVSRDSHATEVEVEVEVEKTQSNTRSASSNPFQPTDRQMYFADRLGITPAQVVKLNKEYGVPAALSAMEQLHGFPPENGVENVYGYLRTVADFKRAGVA